MRRIEKSRSNGRIWLPKPIVEERISGLFDRVEKFSRDKREHHEELLGEERRILEMYETLNLNERALFLSMLYDRFAERYDTHMGVDTNHYKAIKELLRYAGPFIKLPLLDITAGTGEPLKYAIELMESGKKLRSIGGIHPIAFESMPPSDKGLIVANEISLKMLEKAREKLFGVEFTSDTAYDIPDDIGFNTVLCSQTFHIISEDDKALLVKSINQALRIGGTAIIIEEDPFRISPTPSIEMVDIFIRAIACPIRTPDSLIGSFEVNGFNKLDPRASWHIDSAHVMRLHLFQKTKDV